LRGVPLKHPYREGDLVGLALPAGLSRGPQLEVLEPVVLTVAVAMMDVLVSLQGAAEGAGHDQAVFGCVRSSIRQVPFFLGNRHVAIAAGHPTLRSPSRARLSREPTDGYVRPWVAEADSTGSVRLAQPM
jgi:hypothetical protein